MKLQGLLAGPLAWNFLPAASAPFSKDVNQVNVRVNCHSKCARAGHSCDGVESHTTDEKVHLGAAGSYWIKLSFPRLWMQFLYLERDFNNSDKNSVLSLLVIDWLRSEAHLAVFPDQCLCPLVLNNNFRL